MATEQTFIMIKPDGVKRGLVGEVIGRFERRGLFLSALQMCSPPQAVFEEHYAHLKERADFEDIVLSMLAGPVVCMVWTGPNAVRTGRQMLGTTNPVDSPPAPSAATLPWSRAATCATPRTACPARSARSPSGGLRPACETG